MILYIVVTSFKIIQLQVGPPPITIIKPSFFLLLTHLLLGFAARIISVNSDFSSSKAFFLLFLFDSYCVTLSELILLEKQSVLILGETYSHIWSTYLGDAVIGQ